MKLKQPQSEAHRKCYYCCVTFDTIQLFKLHVESIHPGKNPYTCKLCGAAAQSQKGWRKHRRLHLKEPLKCDWCEKLFYCKKSINEHVKKQRVCNQCNTTICCLSVWRNHMKSHNITSVKSCNKSSVCNKCGKSFVRSFEKHVRLCKVAPRKRFKLSHYMPDKSSLFICDICHKAFYSVGYIKQHFRKQHINKSNL